ncbi:hypothetical protein Micbo1qcDRAFT_177222 [Microdochium bolleyi]|uniref:Uncharacterized protein n=1 Tax=Microdochium bolleyi TaxID=196109 RepID=A0A136IWS6_9PEZI|nr:hypothetical protein Micbo1qcDRAFT_177222 [Microdochium bolleyi]
MLDWRDGQWCRLHSQLDIWIKPVIFAIAISQDLIRLLKRPAQPPRETHAAGFTGIFSLKCAEAAAGANAATTWRYCAENGMVVGAVSFSLRLSTTTRWTENTFEDISGFHIKLRSKRVQGPHLRHMATPAAGVPFHRGTTRRTAGANSAGRNTREALMNVENSAKGDPLGRLTT